jgi:hypothetical protein
MKWRAYSEHQGTSVHMATWKHHSGIVWMLGACAIAASFSCKGGSSCCEANNTKVNACTQHCQVTTHARQQLGRPQAENPLTSCPKAWLQTPMLSSPRLLVLVLMVRLPLTLALSYWELPCLKLPLVASMAGGPEAPHSLRSDPTGACSSTQPELYASRRAAFLRDVDALL